MKLLLILLATLFSEANDQYAAGNYAEAAQMYEQLLTETTAITKTTSETYYNLGNAYFKQDELAQAILAYERCLRLDPRNKDAKYNLAFAQSRIIDNIEDNQAYFISSWLRAVRNSLRETTWMWLSISTFLLVLIGALLFALSKEQWLRKTAFYTAVVALIVSACAVANAGSLHSRDTNRAEAITKLQLNEKQLQKMTLRSYLKLCINCINTICHLLKRLFRINLLNQKY